MKRLKASSITAGNPGLCDFYEEFLTRMNENGPGSMPILAHSLLGHSPFVDAVALSHSGLRSQVEAVIEIIDNLEGEYNGSLKVILLGHSVGAWIASQVKYRHMVGFKNAYFSSCHYTLKGTQRKA